MSTTAAVLDPATAVRALSAELHDAVRQLLDSTDREDPTLLDQLRSLSGGLGRKLTAARKRADTEQAPQKPAPAEPKPTTPTATPAPGRAVTATLPRKQAASTAARRTPSSRPHATPASGRHRATPPRPRPTTTPVVYRPTRRMRRLPWLLALALLVLIGSAAAILTDQPLAGVAGSATALGWLLATRDRVTPPVRREVAVVIVAVVLAVTLLTVAVTTGRTDVPSYSPTAPPEVTVIGSAL